MKGIVFNIFSDLVTETFGIETWDELIQRTNPSSNAIYTSAQVYPDGELVAYVTELSKITGTAAPDLIRAFGKYTMSRYKSIHPEFLENQTARSFLQGVHGVIHVEVKKLHPDSILPTFEYESTADDNLTMIYSSPRKLCHLAEGLIDGVSELFDEAIEQQHTQCMHDGAENCRLELRFG
ncbi:MAG: putative hydrocarbon binding protein [Gammaproteobacteria bacterium]|jgi:predicted hydrocarbon binding protein